MSDHKVRKSNFNKDVYRARREAGLSGVEKTVSKRISSDQLKTDTEGKLKIISAPNRRQNRRKRKNRLFTKKGYTRVVKVDDNCQATNIPTKIGSKIHKAALVNSKKIKKENKRIVL